jgi:DNA end-binding protein Ku
MRPIWSGAITFGLIYIPVKLYSASEEQELDFDLLRKDDLCPIRYARVCARTGEEVPWEDIVKGYQIRKGEYVVVTDEDFKRASPKKTKTIEITSFADASEIDARLIEKPYYLEPAAEAAPAYALLHEAMRTKGKVGIASYVLRNREHIATIQPNDSILVLNQLRFASELRDPTDLELPATDVVKPRELEMATKLIDQLTEPFDATKYTDAYTEQLLEFIKEKAAGHAPETAPEEEPVPADVTDLFAKLRESLAQSQK